MSRARREATSPPSAEVAALLDGYPEEMRAALLDLRAVIRAAAPEAVDTISYALPALRYRGRPLVAYGAWKHHLAFYPMSEALVQAHREELRAFDASKGTIRFTPDKPLPRGLVRSLVRARIAQIDAKAERRA